MGGGFYDGDVEERASSSREGVFSFSGHAADPAAAETRREVHPDLNPSGRTLRCGPGTPIIVAMDVTRSRGDDSRIVYSKLPMFIGQIHMQGYVEAPQISFAAIGDATSGDQAPLQVGDFASDNRLDEILSHFWLEEGGGGTGEESYELAAYFYARHVEAPGATPDNKGYLFFVGDEAPYAAVASDQIRALIGDEVTDAVPTSQVFAELSERFHVFFIYPQKSWEERRGDIDAEIRQRVVQAGGQYDDVDIRASLMWNNRNDLDLHVIPPSGEEIFYGHKRSACGGWLDVDMNVRGETLKPVENIRWSQGSAPEGGYRVFVRNYAFHGRAQRSTPFVVELEIDGEVQRFEGTISPRGETGSSSDVTVAQFQHTARARPADDERYTGYADETIKARWAELVGEDHILLLEDPKGIVDVMLGALSLVEGTRDLDAYLVDMKGREQTALRQAQTRRALAGLSSSTALAVVDAGASLPSTTGGKRRKGRTKRL